MFRTLLLSLTFVAFALAESDTGLATVKRLETEAAAASPDVERIRRELLALRVAYPGAVAARAAAVLAILPSPLDLLEASNIPPLEKFDSQPKELVAVVGDHRGRHGGAVAAVAFTTDGQRLASGGAYAVRVWDAATMRLQGMVRVGPVSSVSWSKDGTRLACGTSNGGLHVFDAAPDRPLKLTHSVTVASSGVPAVAFHPEGKYVAAAAGDGPVRVYDVSAAKAEEAASATGHPTAVHCLAYSADGKRLATGGADQTLRVWEPGLPVYKEVSKMAGNPAAVTAVAFSQSGKTLASGLGNGIVQLWSMPAAPKPKAPRVAFAPGKGSVAAMSFTPGGNSLAITNGENGVRWWTVSGAPKFKMKVDGHAGAARGVACSPDGKLIASGGDDWMVRTFDVSKPKPVERFVAPGHLGYAYSSAFTPDGKSMATGGIDKVVRLWDVNGSGPKAGKVLKGEDVPVYSVAYSPDGKFLAASGQSTKVRQWEAATLKVRTSLVRHVSYVNNVVYSPDAKYLMTQSLKEVLLCDPLTGGIHQALAGHTAYIHHASFSPDGQSVATTSGEYDRDDKGRYLLKDGKYVPKDCSLRVFDVENGREQLKWSKYEHAPAHTAWRIDRPELLVVEYPYRLVPTEVGAKELKPGKAWEQIGVRTVLSPDGRFAYTQAYGTVTKVDVKTGKQVTTWTMPEQVGHVALSSDGRHLAVGLETGVVYVLRTEGPRSVTGSK